MKLSEPASFALPKKPRVKEKEPAPDQRKVCVLPIRAINDDSLTDGAFRVLAALCSYCNRAGITWVSQKRLAQEMGVTRQAITNQFSQLREKGYIEVIKKSWRGERPNTIRVIFDQTVDTDTAISITSTHEDTRPPHMQDEQPDPVGQRRVAQLVAQALKPINQPKEYQMPQSNETLTVQKMKAEIAKKKKPKAQSKGQSTVANGHSIDASKEVPIGHSIGNQLDTGEFPETPENTIDEVYKGYVSKEDLKYLKSSGLSDEDIKINFECLRDAYKSEGLTLPTKGLVDQILSMGK